MQAYLLLCFGLLFSYASFGQKNIKLPITEKDESIQWDNKEKQYYSKLWDTEVVANVSKPTMQVFRPTKASNNGTSVVICPGGGLYALSINSEGNDVAKWLAERGVTAFVLRYRLVPTRADAPKQLNDDGARVLLNAGDVLPMSISDGLNAIDYVRKNAEKYDIDPQKIGIMGFSAGGAVTMGVTYNYDEPTRPNFIVPVYAWMDVLPQTATPKDAPPAFIVCASDDPLDLAPASVQIYSSWLKAGKSAELHMFAQGGHGFGMRKQNLPSDQWIERFGEWLTMQGWMVKE